MDVGPDSLAGGEPEIKELVPSVLETTVVPSQTGFSPDPSLTPNQVRRWRFLTGIVTDPISGTVEADGYIDFNGTESRPSGFSNVIVDSLDAELRLQRSYLHGDTSKTVEIQVFDLEGDAEMDRAPSDTAFTAEAQAIRSETYSVSPSDTLFTLSLPTSWIEEHQTAIQMEDSFDNTSFDGFKLVAKSGGSVIGFEHGTARLRVTSPADTVDFRPQKSFTHIERVSGPSQPLPDDMLLVQDGLGVRLKMEWDADSPVDSLARNNFILNRAELTVPVDAAFRMPGGSFVRPVPEGYRILASPFPDGPTCGELRLFAVSNEGETCIFTSVHEWVPEAARASSESVSPIFDRWFLDGAPLASFSVEIANRTVENPSGRQTAVRGIPSTTPVVVRTAGPDPTELPRATLTVTGIGSSQN